MRFLKQLFKVNARLHSLGRDAQLMYFPNQLESEIRLLQFLVPQTLTAIDVGANAGVYSHALSKIAKNVISIEADPKLASELRRLCNANVKILNNAASDEDRIVELRTPLADSERRALSTIEASNNLRGERFSVTKVAARRLSDLIPPETEIGFLKIDVEGHELAVLLGAIEIIENMQPVILVEAEERHRPNAVRSICEFLFPRGYMGLMVKDSVLAPIDDFRVDIHQKADGPQIDQLNSGKIPLGYVNNFIFLPKHRCATSQA
jgi:FkbM family methyltransferase